MVEEGKKAGSFFRIITDRVVANHKLMLPGDFVKESDVQLGYSIQLTIPNGCFWHLGLKKEGKVLCVCDGFKQFMEYYSITFGYYRESLIFVVHIFDLTGCEINYPDSVHDWVHCVFSQGSAGKSNNASGEHEDNAGCSTGVVENCVVVGKALRQQIKGAIDVAKRFKTDHPWFMTILKEYHVKHRFLLHIPRKFSKENPTIKTRQRIKVQDSDGREWPVNCSKERGQVRILGKGWPIFVKEKNLHVGDVCVFELIQTVDPILRVTVFRAEEGG